MVTVWARSRAVVLVLALAGTSMAGFPAAAQQVDDARVRKIESEIRALQRTVFPGGDGRYFTPEVLTPGPQGTPVPNQPSTSAVTDILGRLSSLESQLSRLTAQIEENSNENAQLARRVQELEARLAPPAPVATAPTGVIPLPGVTPTPTLTASANPAPTPTPAPSAARIAAVQAIAKPLTEDPGDDEYTYGFRLWEAKFYPEAQQQLRLFLDKYPRHSRVSYGRNLLGRAYLDEGKPREAAPFFLQNYQNDGQGARAPDSLLYLAETMIAINDTNRACIALAEFAESYPAVATGRLQSQYQANRTKVKCS